MTDEAVFDRATSPSIVQYFRIEGLHGYRTLSLESAFAATLLIAKNGSGKTTLLAALDAFLKGQFSRLRELRFTNIVCKLSTLPEELVIWSDDIARYTTNAVLDAESRRLEIDTSTLYLFLEELTASNERISSDDEIGSAILHKFGYNYNTAMSHCEKLKQSLYAESPNISATLNLLQQGLMDIEVVYLPTYRRIELAVTPTRADRYGRVRKQVLPSQKSGLYSGDIQFGLSDVVERLAQLNQRIVTDSSLGYRELSASIINELISGQFDRADPSQDDIPDRAELELFFSRLKDDRTRRQFGPHFELSIPNIAQIYEGSDGISQESNKFLRYFLGKLNSVVQSTREIEALVRDFIRNCNKYLSSIDVSTTVQGDDVLSPASGETDGKALTLSRRDLTISVSSLDAHRKIPLNSLSSGEKQMISLFAKLYLYPRDKIILIDEPELSLSIDWQRQILVDIVQAPLCRQVIAITHSPFVFDNSLEPFARPLTSTIDADRASEVSDDFETDSQ